MATLIQRYGITPKWGIEAKEHESLLVNSLSFSGQVSEYEQKGSNGNVIGWLAYDQRADWTMSAAMRVNPELDGQGNIIHAWYSMATLLTLNNFAEYNSGLVFNEEIGVEIEGNNPSTVSTRAETSICKTVSSTMTAGEARSLELTGTVYNFNNQPCLDQP